MGVSSGRAVVAMLGLLAVLSLGGCGGGGSGETPAQAATGTYRATLQREAAAVTGWVAWLTAEIKRDRITAAQSRYAAARVPFGHLTPLVIAYPSLDSRLDGENDAPPGKLKGFHEVEAMLWTKTPKEVRLKAVGQLLLSAKELQERARTTKFTPEELARHMEEVMVSKIARALLGDEELHSHIDLLDASADVEGLEAAFEEIEPVLVNDWPGLVKEIQRSFKEVYAGIREFGTPAKDPVQARPIAPGVAFVGYDGADHTQVEQLKWRLETLGKHIAELSGAIMTSEHPPEPE